MPNIAICYLKLQDDYPWKSGDILNMVRKILLLILLVGVTAFILKDKVQRQFFKPNDALPQNELQVRDNTENDVEEVAVGLDIPWEVVFLPNGNMLLTERPGTLLLIGKDRKKIPVEGVSHRGEGGLMGLVLHPKFSENSFIYLYFTSRQGEGLANRVERYKLEGEKITNKKVILEGIPSAIYHDGGRIAFGPDNYLYIATGDAGQEKLAQDTNSLAGKILRVTDEGEIPNDNPFGNSVYTYGHRNVQGLTWDSSGTLWASEHGPSGTQTGNDELNKIEKGKNYGWPDSKGDDVKAGTVAPVIHSGNNTWAPAGAEYFKNKILFTGLRGEAVYEYDISTKKLEQNFKSEFGRLRTIKLGPDGYFYLLTNNTDGRGDPKEKDDKVLKINPRIFE